ncbi:acyl-CoA thioesterase [Methylobacterium oryzisoli]|uniref:acyl-CoA thioesterase n=1 Tax=Methylobacterium oryzisoli TaxID=3385502 RepID=UPI0038920424
MPANALRSVSWAPTIAMSWLWGLGFFYAIHVTLTYGWLGFVGFAAPNVLGLFLFGWVLGAPGRDPAQILKTIQGSYAGVFLLCQLAAVAITIFGFLAYAWRPMLGAEAALIAGVVILGSCAIGHAVGLKALRGLHAAYLALGVGAALVAFGALQGTSEAAVPVAAFDARFYGLVLPSLVGFLLGPWTDLQQWQRAVEIRASGGSVRTAYGVGAVLFLGLLVLNACLAAAAGPAAAFVAADGVPGAQPAVAVAAGAVPAAGVAFLVWTLIAATSTLDSAYASIRWFMSSLTARSSSPLLAFVSPSLVSSPLWLILAALAIAVAMISANLSMMYLMLPFCTLLVGGAACLVGEVLGAERRYDGTLCAMLGLAAALIFLAGYLGPAPLLATAAPLLALVGAAPTLAGLWRKPAADAPRPVAAVPAPAEPAPALVTLANENHASSYGFDGQWFVFHMTPTYDDTNSVGNIYFANYVRWVGKARELFFNVCMPDFSLASTDFYVLTRDFNHQFRREAKEFEPIVVRIRISAHSRKFVTLAHEIHSETHGLLGRGEQSLMFVDTVHYRPLDIPRSIVKGFLPYFAGSVAASPAAALMIGEAATAS